MDEDFSRFLGWLGADETQRGLAADIPHLSQVAPHLYGGDDDKSPVLLHKAVLEVLGKWPGYVPQQIGDCVSHGFGHANDICQCVEIALDGRGEFRETHTEFLYAASREIAGILRPPGRFGDGSYGGAAVKAMTQVGMISREMAGADGKYDGDRAGSWGWHGAPEKYKTMASSFKLGTNAKITSFEDAAAALRSGHPGAKCCGWYGQGRRDQDGFVSDWGRGGHCQAFLGVRFDRPGVLILNSWPDSVYSGPLIWGMTQQMYWITADWFNKAAAEGDTFAISSTPYFVKRDLPKAWRWSDAA